MGAIRRAGTVLALRGGQCAARAPTRLRRELGGSLVERRRRCKAASRLGTPGGALELSRDLLVECGHGLCSMPGTTVRIDLRIGHFRQRTVSIAAGLPRGRSIDRRAHEGVTKAHLRAERDEIGGLSGSGRVDPDVELLGCTPQQHRIANGLGSRQEQEQPRRRWK